nr:MAG TPA: hypothetical protein [Caudoviricetes sp.]
MKQVIFFDDEDMKIYNVKDVVADVEGKTKNNLQIKVELSLSVSSEPIELDPTTMLRIAKYNKEVEIEKLQEKIETLKNTVISWNKAIDKTKRKISYIEKLAQTIFEDDNFFEEKYKPSFFEEE